MNLSPSGGTWERVARTEQTEDVEDEPNDLDVGVADLAKHVVGDEQSRNTRQGRDG